MKKGILITFLMTILLSNNIFAYTVVDDDISINYSLVDDYLQTIQAEIAQYNLKYVYIDTYQLTVEGGQMYNIDVMISQEVMTMTPTGENYGYMHYSFTGSQKLHYASKNQYGSYVSGGSTASRTDLYSTYKNDVFNRQSYGLYKIIGEPEQFETVVNNSSYLDYILVIPNQEKVYDSWNVKVSVQESTPMGDYWKYLDQYVFSGKNTWKFDKSSPIWQGRNKLYKFEITYINNDEDVGVSVIEPSWNPIEEQRNLMPKFTIKNNDWKIQLASTYEADYSIVLNKVLVPSTVVNTSVIPVNLVDDVYRLSDTFTTFYNMPENEVGFYYELYIMSSDKAKLYAKFNWTRNDLKDWKKYDFTIDTPLKYDVVSLVSNQYGSQDYVDITPDVSLDENNNLIIARDPLDNAIKGLESLKQQITSTNDLMLYLVTMFTGYPLIGAGITMMVGVLSVVVLIVIVKLVK